MPKPVPKTPISSPTTSPPPPGVSEVKEKEKEKEKGEGVNGKTRREGGVKGGAKGAEKSAQEGEGMEVDEDPSAGAGVLPSSKRVKVYELIGGRWHDRGTGFCNAEYDSGHDRAMIGVRDEENGAEILRSSIHPSDVYQKQTAIGPGHNSQARSPPDSEPSSTSKAGTETLIVWTEPDGTDFALSFQDAQGCKEMWDFICEVQNHLVNIVGESDTDVAPSDGYSPPMRPLSPFSASSVPSSPELRGPAPPDAASMNTLQQMLHDILNEGRLPTPQMGNIREIEAAFKMVTRTTSGKVKLCECVLTQDFWKACIEVHKQAEDLESLEDLHALCKLAQFLLLLNDPSTYDYIVQDEVFLGVMGMLEYDPEWPSQKATYRDFLSTVSHYRQPIDFHNPVLVRKIHNVYRLQYIMDVVLARVLDDPVFNVLKSCMLFQQVEIIQHITNDDALLRELFSLFTEDDPTFTPPPGPTPAPPPDLDSRRRDVLLLTNQLCAMGKTVQLPLRLSLYRKLVDRGLMPALQWAFRTGLARPDVLSAAGEILIVVVDHDAQGVRQFVLRQADYPPPPGTSTSATAKRKLTLIDTLQQLLASAGVDMALKSQITDASRLLLELPGQEVPLPPEHMTRPRDDVMEAFLTWFYDKCIREFYAPIFRLQEFQLASKDPPTLPEPPTLPKMQIPHILYLCELLATFVIQHTHRSAYFVLNTGISTRMATLLLVKEKHIRIAALRYFRALLRINNQFVHRQLIGKDLFFPLIELGGREAKRDGLLTSCYLEYFEYLRRENIKSVINHMMSAYGDRIRSLAESRNTMGRIFKDLILRWEQNNDVSVREAQSSGGVVSLPPPRRWGQGRLPETEEEEYFNGSDDEEDAPHSPVAENRGLKRKEHLLPAPNGGLARGPTPPLRPTRLVDYDDNEDEDMDWEADAASKSKAGQFDDAPTTSGLRQPFAGQDFGPARTILRPRAIHTNGLGPSTLPLSPVPGPRMSETRVLRSAAQEERNGVRTPSPPPSRLGARKSPPPSPRPGPAGPSGPRSPPRISEKRKRDEEDDDDVLGSLERSKRRSITPDVGADVGLVSPRITPVSAAGKEEKKIKLKLTRSAITVASPTPAVPPVPSPTTAAKDNG